MMVARSSTAPRDPISVRVPSQRPRISVIIPKREPSTRSANDGATTLALHLAAVRAELALDVVVVIDLGGTTLAAVGDPDAAEELAHFARSLTTLAEHQRAEAIRRVGVLVAPVTGDVWVAATAERSLRDADTLVAMVREAVPDEHAAEDEALAASLSAAFDADDEDPFGDWVG
ncbi:MAG: hypothetical protein JNL79_23280 [Myxococcales bacterium]|nr:hypothetical protein [Myxococcales bacterium]